MAPKTELVCRRSVVRARRPAALALSALAIAGLAGCANPLRHAAGASAAQQAAAQRAAKDRAAVTSREQTQLICAGQTAWNARAASSMKALYADTGALAADASAGNRPGVVKAGRQLAADAVAAATLPLPSVGASSWKTLTAAYAAAGTALAAGSAAGAVPQLETGGSAISVFTSAVAKCGPSLPE